MGAQYPDSRTANASLPSTPVPPYTHVSSTMTMPTTSRTGTHTQTTKFARLRPSTHARAVRVPKCVATTRGDGTSPTTADPAPPPVLAPRASHSRTSTPRSSPAVCPVSTPAPLSPAPQMAAALAPPCHGRVRPYTSQSFPGAYAWYCISAIGNAHTPAPGTNANTNGHRYFRPPSVAALARPALAAAALPRT